MVKENMDLISWYKESDIEINQSIGVDEVGRGPLAGPVVSAAVWIDETFANNLIYSGIKINDSKKMSAAQRKKVIKILKEQSNNLFRYEIGIVDVQEIDSLNILNAAMLSMEKALLKLTQSIESEKFILIDGNKIPKFNLMPDFREKSMAIVKGDSKILSISLASIIAKEYRDSVMIDLSKKFPAYSWGKNMGYGTKEHLKAIESSGITPHHRKTFSPIRKSI